MFKNWTNRDWFWLLSFLIGIIILMIAGFYNSNRVELNFSIISSAVSIALALVAISISIKQDSDNQVVTRETSNALMKIRGKIETVDNKIDRLDPNSVTKPAENQLIKEVKSIFESKEEDAQKLEEITKTINSKFENINNQLNRHYNNQHNYKALFDITSNTQDVKEFLVDFMELYNLSTLGHEVKGNVLKLSFNRDSLIKLESIENILKKYNYHLIDVGLNL
ncbi:hypothetical protein MKY15_20685 [Sporosarcina sp. FSL K6-1540]|uniref:hypothetical protein n=1 Tax=Sporosarcina sp. FSL K6-1540 TaxID=2921555 RepID=UPI00315A8D69